MNLSGIKRPTLSSARLFAMQLLMFARNPFTSSCAKSAVRSCASILPKNLLRLFITISTFLSLFSGAGAGVSVGVVSCAASSSASSFSISSISSERFFLAASCSAFSESNFSTSSSTTFCASSASSPSAFAASSIACVSSASRFSKSASLALRASSAFLATSSFFLKTSALSIFFSFQLFKHLFFPRLTSTLQYLVAFFCPCGNRCFLISRECTWRYFVQLYFLDSPVNTAIFSVLGFLV